MLPCATLLTGAAWSGLPLLCIRADARERVPLQPVAQPLLMVLRRGRVHLHGRGQAVVHGIGMVSLLPCDADDQQERWSTPACAEYLGVELPTAACEAWLQRASAWARAGDPVLRFHDARVLHWASELQSHALAGEPYGALYTQSVSLALVAYLDARQRSQALPVRAGVLAPRLLQRVREHVEAHLDQPLRLVELAALCGYSPQHFTRLFRAATGSAVHAWVLERRLDAARRLLVADRQPIAEIALACGFASQSHLHAVFRQRCGTTPGAYRRCRLP